MKTAERGALVAAARGWLGTPFHHQASVKGVGCDCVGLIRGVAAELGMSQGTTEEARYQGYSRSPDSPLCSEGWLKA